MTSDRIIVPTDTDRLGRCDVTVVILTFNEEANIAAALDSVCGWARHVIVLDSFSTDDTLAIARRYPVDIRQRKFDNFSKQRNFAIDEIAISTEWIFFLDADEWLPNALCMEISELVRGPTSHNGFYVNRRLIWMGKWIRRGYYPSWILRLFRRGAARCEDRGINEHMQVNGTVGYLRSDMMHEDRKDLGSWLSRHDGYAKKEALTLVKQANAGENEISEDLFGSQSERKRWIRRRVWNRLPPLVRPFFYFIYRYVLAGGFLDGREAFIYHFFQALWFPMLIDVRYIEAKRPPKLSL